MGIKPSVATVRRFRAMVTKHSIIEETRGSISGTRLTAAKGIRTKGLEIRLSIIEAILGRVMATKLSDQTELFVKGTGTKLSAVNNRHLSGNFSSQLLHSLCVLQPLSPRGCVLAMHRLQSPGTGAILLILLH